MKFSDFLPKAWQAATLTPPPIPKAPNSVQAVPAYRTTIAARTTPLLKVDRQLANTDRLEARTKASTWQVLRELSQSSPELSASIFMTLRTAIPNGFTLVARDLDGQVSRDGTALAHELLNRLTFMGSSDGSYGAQMSLNTLSEQLGKELLIHGAACVELALDKQRIPASLNVIGINTLRFYEEDSALRLVQYVGGQEINLDIPTVIYTTLDQLVSEATPSSPLEASIQTILADLEFNNDIRKTLKRSTLPRLKATIDSEKVRKMTPPEILSDPEKFATYQNALIEAISTTINGLNPEDVLVSFDVVDYAFIDGGGDPSAIIEKVQKVLNSKLASGVKALPVTLGYSSTSNGSSTESLLFLKQSDAIRRKLNELYSRALTVAIRLSGVEGFVEFNYDQLDLRPDSELEAFKAMRQSRILEQLSMGFITDDEASLQLCGHLTPDGYTPKSGTMFKGGSQPVSNPTSNTSAVERTIKPATPTQPKSPTKAEVGKNLATARQ